MEESILGCSLSVGSCQKHPLIIQERRDTQSVVLATVRTYGARLSLCKSEFTGTFTVRARHDFENVVAPNATILRCDDQVEHSVATPTPNSECITPDHNVKIVNVERITIKNRALVVRLHRHLIKSFDGGFTSQITGKTRAPSNNIGNQQSKHSRVPW